MLNRSSSVESTQIGPHKDLLKTVQKHRGNIFKRPVAMHTQLAFENVIEWLNDWQGDVILDACCGVGESTLYLASQFPNTRVIGIDKSIARLQKHKYYANKRIVKKENPAVNATENTRSDGPAISNYIVVQADLNDFWRLLRELLISQPKKPPWRLIKQYILYPNPYPKKSQLGKRWHASAIFPSIIECCEQIEVRSNWHIYAQEFAIAAKVYGIDMRVQTLTLEHEHAAITPFERKYAAANQLLWTAKTLGTG